MSLCLWSSQYFMHWTTLPSQSRYSFLMNRKCMIKWRNILVHGPWSSIVKFIVVGALSLSLSISINLISNTSLPLLFPSSVKWQSHISLSFMQLNEAPIYHAQLVLNSSGLHVTHTPLFESSTFHCPLCLLFHYYHGQTSVKYKMVLTHSSLAYLC